VQLPVHGLHSILATADQRATSPTQGDAFRHEASMLERITIAARRAAFILQPQNRMNGIFRLR
jgi:hypothetical protein